MLRELTDEPWAVPAPVLPPPVRMGCPRADDRKTLASVGAGGGVGPSWAGPAGESRP